MPCAGREWLQHFVLASVALPSAGPCESMIRVIAYHLAGFYTNQIWLGAWVCVGWRTLFRRAGFRVGSRRFAWVPAMLQIDTSTQAAALLRGKQARAFKAWIFKSPPSKIQFPI